MDVELIGFSAVSATVLLSAIRVVTSPHLIRSVLWLGITLSMTAFLFVLLRSPFLAGVQILLYTGGVITLMLFGVMLTRRHDGAFAQNEQTGHAKGALFAGALFAVLATAIINTDGLTEPAPRAYSSANTEQIGNAFLSTHLFAFELLSVLLLVVMVGAIVIARKADFGTPKETHGPLRPLGKVQPEPDPSEGGA
jgi:NADH-quinone oxidoreductase subunit J